MCTEAFVAKRKFLACEAENHATRLEVLAAISSIDQECGLAMNAGLRWLHQKRAKRRGQMDWPKGSEWRKWDLHVHSPASAKFKGDWNQFIIQLGNADCDVIGINDYFSVAGYKEVHRRLNDPSAAAEGNKAYREALEKLKLKTLLPVVECRMNNVVVDKKFKSGSRIISI